MTQDSQATMRLSLLGEDDAASAEAAIDDLASELRNLDLDDVRAPTAGPPPSGAKAVDPVMAGALILGLARSPQLLGAVVHTVDSWLQTRKGSVVVEIDGDRLELVGGEKRLTTAAVEVFVERHTAGGKR